MSGTHKYPTISFRISPREREEIEAKIFTSGMKKKDYFVRSCIYNRVCVVGKKETVYQIVERLQEMENLAWISSDRPSARDRDAWKDSPPDNVFTLRSVPL